MDNKKLNDTIWPPPPRLPNPTSALQEPFIIRLSLEMLILVDLAVGLVSGGVHCLVRLLSHRPIDLQDTAIGASVFAAMFFVMHLGLRAYFKNLRESKLQETDLSEAEK